MEQNKTMNIMQMPPKPQPGKGRSRRTFLRQLSIAAGAGIMAACAAPAAAPSGPAAPAVVATPVPTSAPAPAPAEGRTPTSTPEVLPAIEQPFLMPIEEVFSIKGRGTVVTGRIERGVIHPMEEVDIVGLGATRRTLVTGVERFSRLLDEGQAGDNVGILLRGIDRAEVQRGQVLAQPGSITAHTTFESEVYVVKQEEGGQHRPFFKGYRPQFYIRTINITGEIQLPEGVEAVMPGEIITLTVELILPVALEEGDRFAIRESDRTVGEGVVTRILE